MTAHDPRVTLTDAERALLDDKCPSNDETDGWEYALLHRTVEHLIAARLAPIRALAEEWERTAGSDLDILDVETMVQAEHFGFRSMRRLAGKRLRAALDAASADLTASQDHDGAEGQGEGEKAGEGRRCPTCGIPFAHYTHDPQGRPL